MLNIDPLLATLLLSHPGLMRRCLHTLMQREPPPPLPPSPPLAEMLQCVSLSQDWVSVTQPAAMARRNVPIATANKARGGWIIFRVCVIVVIEHMNRAYFQD